MLKREYEGQNCSIARALGCGALRAIEPGVFEIFGNVAAPIGLVVAFEAWRQRPGSHRHSTEPKEAQLEQAS